MSLKNAPAVPCDVINYVQHIPRWCIPNSSTWGHFLQQLCICWQPHFLACTLRLPCYVLHFRTPSVNWNLCPNCVCYPFLCDNCDKNCISYTVIKYHTFQLLIELPFLFLLAPVASMWTLITMHNICGMFSWQQNILVINHYFFSLPHWASRCITVSKSRWYWDSWDWFVYIDANSDAVLKCLKRYDCLTEITTLQCQNYSHIYVNILHRLLIADVWNLVCKTYRPFLPLNVLCSVYGMNTSAAHKLQCVFNKLCKDWIFFITIWAWTLSHNHIPIWT